MIVNRQIGGSGGGESASIFVQGLSATDTVSCTKDGKSYSGRWVSKEMPTYGAYGAYGALVPTMTSNTTPSGQCYVWNRSPTTSSNYTEPYLAFDGNDSTTWNNHLNTNVNIAIGYRFPQKTVVSSFGFKQTNGGAYAKTFKLQYSDDGNSWIDVQNYTFDNSSTNINKFQTYSITNEQSPHYYWRLYSLTQAISNCNWCISTMQFYGTTAQTVNGWQFDKLKSYGTYTITSGSKTQNVLVDFATEFDISL